MAVNKMAILQDVDKCMRCNGCVTACKREWNLKLPTTMADPLLGKATVKPRQRLAIKSVRRGDMGPFTRFSCWHCPDPPCASACPFGAIKEEASGAINVDNSLCKPALCNSGSGLKPCQKSCQQGGYPKVGVAYETGTYAGLQKMNKCTLCAGRAGSDAQVGTDALPTRARKNSSGQYVSEISGLVVDELAHEPACVSTCPAKAMKWDTKENIQSYLDNPANGYGGNWVGNGAIKWASKQSSPVISPKADPFIEDHITPMVGSMVSGSGKLAIPALLLGGFAVVSMRRAKVQAEVIDMSVREV
jgi:Fe-S-cluster-containing dehydrogenase component